jgi:hypothetical protein
VPSKQRVGAPNRQRRVARNVRLRRSSGIRRALTPSLVLKPSSEALSRSIERGILFFRRVVAKLQFYDQLHALPFGVLVPNHPGLVVARRPVRHHLFVKLVARFAALLRRLKTPIKFCSIWSPGSDLSCDTPVSLLDA